MEREIPMNSDRSTEFIKYSCPSCGATLELDPFNPVVKCEYCGCNFLKTDDVSKKILLDALEIKKLEQKLLSAIESNSWDIQYTCYKALAEGTDNPVYQKFYSFWEVLLGRNDITADFIKQYSLEELDKFIELMHKMPSTCAIMGNPLAILGVEALFTRVINACKSSEYTVSDAVDMEFGTERLGIRPSEKSKFPAYIFIYGLAAIISGISVLYFGLCKDSLVISAVVLGAAFIINSAISIVNDKFDASSLARYKIVFPNGILSATSMSLMSTYAAMQSRGQIGQLNSVTDTELLVYQDGIDISYKRLTVKNGRQTSVAEHMFIPYINIASVHPIGINAISIKQRYTNSAYAFEVEEVTSTELQALVAYIHARMRHYQISKV